MRIMVRRAQDEFIAMQTAQGMENAGATVFSITSDGQETYYGATKPHTRFCVWAKIESDSQIDAIDEAINDEVSR